MTTIVELGTCGPVDRADPGWAGQLRLVPCARAVVCPQRQLRDGTWLCRVVARQRPQYRVRFSAEYVVLTAEQLANARRHMLVDPHRPDEFAMVWLSLVWRRWQLSAMFVAATALVHGLRQPGTIVVDLDHNAHERLVAVTRLHAAAVLRMMDRLVETGRLTPATVASGGGDGLFALAISSDLASLSPMDGRRR